jgi:D-serine deaminase-like pyridoxal phosphate-dependent protein
MERACRDLLTIEQFPLPSPCLVVEAAALQRNLLRAANFFAGRKVKLRPHFKAHKCTTLMRRQLAAGGCSGVTCATAAEALVLANAGFDDVLVANQVVDARALVALGAAAHQAHMTVAVDSIEHVQMLEALAVKEAIELDVLIEIDVGLHRCGLEPGSSNLLPLATAIARARGLTFAGLQGYEGHAVFVVDRVKRKALVQRAGEMLASECNRLTSGGFECRLVTGGGTGTYDLAAEFGVLNEIQAGSYVLMDGRYATLDLPFEHALYCVTTVISRRGSRAVVDAGLKSVSAEYGLPRSLTEGVEALDLSDEHLQVAVADDVDLQIGQRMRLIPAHVDPTVNLHDALFFLDDDHVETWPIDGRRHSAGSLLSLTTSVGA